MVKDGIFFGKRYEVLSKIGAGGMADVYKEGKRPYAQSVRGNQSFKERISRG